MYLLALMFGILLLPEASTLRCYECTPDDSGTCTPTPKECPGQCAAKRDVTYSGGSRVEIISQKCLKAEECVDHSINYGLSQTKVTTKCCNTSDLCNTQTVPELQSKPNGRLCYYCDDHSCTNTLMCEGIEQYCVSLTETRGGQQVTKKGCASNYICTAKDKFANITTSCCQGNLCNGAISSRIAGLVLLAPPLLSLLGTSY
ncbi:urokinase plasminogen activator surface receptor-like [Perca flavescens]|uniref:urokinase plasminogen activator surface receptor-like n=1 Tax=Perca flavescens TaxID=8167 RepID=UPI00106EE4B0|nr:urokinase plasminogen activator surface receptor-like [Perca flavescens]